MLQQSCMALYGPEIGVGGRRALAVGLLQATSLPFLVTASQIAGWDKEDG